MLRVIDIAGIESMCDMGAGAGFPSIPIKILFPHVNVTIIDSLNKRIKFLEILKEKLELTDVYLVHDRIENFAIKNQNKFDIVTARALGALPLICELGIPMLKVHGHFIAYKSSAYIDELNSCTNALKILGSSISQIEEFSLPMQFGDRTLVKIIKKKQTNGYPRSFATILKKPL
jgi:16S rRNA (guanine527-N7)-methyltransferase